MDTKEKKQFNLSLSDEGDIIKTSRGETPKKTQPSVWFYLGTFGNIGLSIALPIVIGVLVGSWIDTKYGSKPTATLIGIIIGFIISIFGFVQMIRKVIRGDYNPK